MDLDKLLSLQEKCINENPPACITKCPLHVDVKAFMKEAGKGNFEEAYKILKKRIPLVNLVGTICEHPCSNCCKVEGLGEEINIHELERAVISYGRNAKIKTLPMPKNNKKIAVIGAGVSSLTCASYLNEKGYKVYMFEKEEKAGGSFLKFIDEKAVEEEVIELNKQGTQISLKEEIKKEDLDRLSKEYDAVYLGTGKWDDLNIDNTTLQIDNSNIFAGGSLLDKDISIINSVYTGRKAAISIDRFVNGKSMTALRENEGPYESKLISSETIKSKSIKKSKDVYTKEEVMEEAKRCIQCECNLCLKACRHLQNAKFTQKAYIRTINQNERIILGDHYANKIINACNMCGLCGVQCPVGINMAEVIGETRRSMVEKEKMPGSTHDFAIRDMKFSNSKFFELLKHEPQMDESKYLFFPGCQLGASNPDLVIKSYEYLRKKLSGGVGLYLSCCGAPADWAGQSELYNKTLERIKDNIEKMGNPMVIMACSTCFRNFKRAFKDINIKSLWEIINEEGIPEEALKGNEKTLMIHDACTTREEKIIHESVRKIAHKLNYKIEEPFFTRENTKCCGFGGNVFYSNRKFSTDVTEDRIKDSKNDFLVYCANCRDLFVLNGKNSYHILDLLFKNEKELNDMKVATLSERQVNRVKLKKHMLKTLWNEESEAANAFDSIKIIVNDELRKKLEEELILDSNIKEVIYYEEKTKNSFYNEENGHILAFNKSGNITYWVEYKRLQDAYEIIDAYSHRMDVTGV